MEKDNKVLGKFLDEFRKLLLGVAGFFEKIIDRVIARIHAIDPKENTKQRVITALFMIPFAIYAIFYSLNLFIIFALLIAIIMTFEWLTIIKSLAVKDKGEYEKWQLIGLIVILVPVFSVVKIRLIDTEILFWMFAIIWSTDIFAFFAGRILGGPKLAPSISPNKTWTGLAGGVFASVLIGIISSLMFPGSLLFFICVSALLSIIEQSSDLLESKFKRTFGVKDSGNIIPGHGGVLDRMDGLILAAPTTLILITVFADKFGL